MQQEKLGLLFLCYCAASLIIQLFVLCLWSLLVMEYQLVPLLLLLSMFLCDSSAQIPGFLSLDCGGKEDFTDDLGLDWISDDSFIAGHSGKISVAGETRQQYMTVRYFAADSRKYCYSLDTKSRTRYLLRATFLYGNFDSNNVYPKFDISVGATHWSTIVISDISAIESIELIFLASSPVSVCLSNATTGQPFISTLELRELNGSIYYTPFEMHFYLSVSARINFGADAEAPIRYPDDPFDRIWESDSVKKANYLVDVATGTKKVTTNRPIDVGSSEMPPVKVMQTAVVGTNGSLTYRLNLDGFPGFGWAVTYLAEIENLGRDESRKFRLLLPGHPDMSKALVDIQENAPGKFRLYEPGYPNISLPFVLSFKFVRTPDSSRGPLLNAMEISKYLEKNDGSPDRDAMAGIVSVHSSADWAREGGDPCLPVSWSWLQCSSDPQPRITKIFLSNKNLTGSVSLELAKLGDLVELWLDGNFLTGPVPDFSGCTDLKIIHLENNQLTGDLPSSLMNLQRLKELYVQNNMLSGELPLGLLKKNMILNYSGNMFHEVGEKENHADIFIFLGALIGGVVVLIIVIIVFFFICKRKKKHSDPKEPWDSAPVQRIVSTLGDGSAQMAHCFTFSEIEGATNKFRKRIGSGGFGIVYYGELEDGKEIAVKVLTTDSFQGMREFLNEMTLLSRIHHRNLVQFIGYCRERGNMLVYEFMHNGTLKEHIYGQFSNGKCISWIKRLEIAEDAAKGIEYLHTGCVPAVIHRDLKTSNILLDKDMRAKVSDFGLSKLAIDGVSHVSSIVRGTVGYLDPEYYISQQLTDKSDVYSFGVILLELMSGREPVSNESFGNNCRNIVQWAKSHIEGGNVEGIIDPKLGDGYDVQSMWKIAEKALMCVLPHGNMRPPISLVLKEIQDAIAIEKEAAVPAGAGGRANASLFSDHSSLHLSSFDLGGTEHFPSMEDVSMVLPAAR